VTYTAGTLLGGRVRYEQPAEGYRTGLEPVLLAASVPAEAGDRVLEAGTGAGAGLLCLAARVAGFAGVGVELDPALAALAAANFASNGFDHLTVQACDLLAWQPASRFDHAFANPPWHDAAATASPVAARRAAKQAGDGLLRDWIAAMGGLLRPQGTLSLILPVACLNEAMVSLEMLGFQEVTLFPLWPYQGRPAKMIILQGKYRGRGRSKVLFGLVLHDPAGLTEEAEMILRSGGALPLGRCRHKRQLR